MRNVEYEYAHLPAVPFNIYFIDHNGSIKPKRIFTVTRKEINVGKKCIRLYVLELYQYIDFNQDSVQVVAEFFAN